MFFVFTGCYSESRLRNRNQNRNRWWWLSGRRTGASPSRPSRSRRPPSSPPSHSPVGFSPLSDKCIFLKWCPVASYGLHDTFINPLRAVLRIRICRIQGCGSVFIFYGSGSGSSGSGWRPIRIRIQSGSRALMPKNWKKITAEKK